MEIVHSRCAGMDVSKRDAKVCVRVAGRGRRKTVETVCTWGSTTNAILTLREHLINEQVSLVVMEATGDYWKPFYYLLEDADFEVMLVNARHVKNLPGRKSDVSDAAWLAQLGAHGLATAAHLASWAGTCPGSNESAGRVKSTATRHPGNPYLKAARHRRVIHREQPHAHLPRRQVPTHRRPPRTQESTRRDRTHDLGRDLEHGPHRSALRRPRRRLLHPPRPRTRSPATP